MANSNENGRLTASELSAAALSTVHELTGYNPEAVTGFEWDGEHWRITVDARELSRVPNTTDGLGAYALRLDDEGKLHGYRRTRRFVRGQPSEG